MDAQSQLYQLFSDKLFALCLKYSKNFSDAEDTLHDSFLIIFQKINQYNNKGSFEGWLKRITINVALEKYRNHTYLNEINESTVIENAEELEFDTESLSLDYLLGIVQQLPDRYRLVFNLYVLDNYPHKEIAKMLHISEGTSKSNLLRARKLLYNQIINYKEQQNQSNGTK